MKERFSVFWEKWEKRLSSLENRITSKKVFDSKSRNSSIKPWEKIISKGFIYSN